MFYCSLYNAFCSDVVPDEAFRPYFLEQIIEGMYDDMPQGNIHVDIRMPAKKETYFEEVDIIMRNKRSHAVPLVKILKRGSTIG